MFFRKMIFQTVCIFGIFVPFVAGLVAYCAGRGQNVFDPYVTMTRVGWRPEIHGWSGWMFLAFFVLFSGSFLVYQVYFYLKATGMYREKFGVLMLYLCMLGAGFMISGAAIPYRYNRADTQVVWHFFHNAFSMVGAMLGVVVVTMIFFRHFKKGKRLLPRVFYIDYVFFVWWAYTGWLLNAVMFEVGLAFSFFIVMYIVNLGVLRRGARG